MITDPKFTVIIPIYNSGRFLKETLESVINQSIGFRDNIHVVLVNDGSKDNSEEICLDYVNKYEDNIEYIRQENQGVVAARNRGLEHIRGKYISFLDADDKWAEDAFKKAYDFFESHYDEIDVVSGRVKQFGADTGYHMLDYKFSGDRIVDITKEYNCIILSTSTVFFKAEAIKNQRFNIKSKISEDIPFVNEVLFEKGRYGVLRSAEYMYRKDLGQSSAIDNSRKKRDFYITVLEEVYPFLFNLSEKKYGSIIPYVQYLVAYDIIWKMTVMGRFPAEMSKSEIDHFYELLKITYDKIEDRYLIEQKPIPLKKRLSGLAYKHGGIHYDDKPILEDWKVRIALLYQDKTGKLCLEGRDYCEMLSGDYQLIAIDSKNNEYPCDCIKDPTFNYSGVDGEVLFEGTRFTMQLPWKAGKYKFCLKNQSTGERIAVGLTFGQQTQIGFGLFKKISNKYVGSANRQIIVKDEKSFSKLKYELRQFAKLIKRKQYSIIAYRFLANIIKKFKKKEIWIISDRTFVAGDNGEAFFKYVEKNADKSRIKSYFLIDKQSEDFERMRGIGKVIHPGSFKYKLLFTCADKIVSSQADNWTTNAFGEQYKFIRDIPTFRFIFLQHGIIKDDLSEWLHKQNKAIDIIVTSAKPEYDSVINGAYGYSEDEVLLSGMPRYDLLENEPKRIVSIMPTWRKSLATDVLAGTSERPYSATFKNSEYCVFYNNLINDERILDAMRQHNYTGVFYVHPATSNQAMDFHGNDVITASTSLADYRKVFRESDLMITDYSSVAFDFAYLNKPVVYTQFDIDTFFKEHSYKEGYYSYERDGFGPVCYNYEDSVQAIVELIENECCMTEEYANRSKKFFAYTDKNNCKRVYDAICAMK